MRVGKTQHVLRNNVASFTIDMAATFGRDTSLCLISLLSRGL